VANDPVPLCEPFEFGDEPTALYRLYAADGNLIYLGITTSPASRMEQHAEKQPWWPEVALRTMAWYATRMDAAVAETAAIKAEKPQYNKKTTLANGYTGKKHQTVADLIAADKADDWVHVYGMSSIRVTPGNRAKRFAADK
jgi:predicted GIY-YIG superfamily endonuclease